MSDHPTPNDYAASEYGTQPRKGPCVELISFSSIQPEVLRWTWPGRIPCGKLVLLVGEPEAGKTHVAIDIAAYISTGGMGALWPDGALCDGPSSTIILSSEDDAADTIRPRLDAAGADVGRVALLRGTRLAGGALRQFDLKHDLERLEDAIQRMEDCKLIVIDPISAYLGGADSHRDAEVRTVLGPLVELAARHGVTVLGITHCRKSGDGPALHRSIGSIGFIAAARAAWLVCKDPEDEDRRLFLPLKNNLGRHVGGLAFRLCSPDDDTPAYVQWEEGPVTLSADDALAKLARSTESGGAAGEAAEWLRDLLAGGPQPAVHVKECAERDGIKPRTLDRAKRKLEVRSFREGFGPDGAWSWALPKDANSS